MLGKETSYQGRKEINVLILDLHNQLWHNGSVFDEYVVKGEKEFLYQVNINKK